MSPERALGIPLAQISRDFLRESGYFLREALIFCLAHEAGHIAYQHKFKKLRSETEATFLERCREQESAADRYALDIMARRPVSVGAINVLVATWIIYEPKSFTPADDTHPPDYLRLKAILEKLAARKNEWRGTAAERTEFNGELEKMLTIVGAPEKVEQFYSERDAALQKVTVRNLRRY